MLVRSALLLLAGGFAAQHSRVPLSWDHAPWLFVATVLLLRWRRGRPMLWSLCGAVLLLLAVQAGMGSQLETRFSGESVMASVYVADFPRRAGETVTMIVEPVADQRLPARMLVSWFDPPVQPALGDTWQFEMRLRRPRGLTNPGGFDREAWMMREHLHAAAYVIAGKRNRLLASGRPGGLAGMRYSAVRAMAPHNADSLPVLAALGVGSRHLISDAQWDRYALTGTSHLVAISGLHIGLAAVAAFIVFFLLAAALRLHGNHFRISFLAGVSFAAGYAAISGFGVPAQRAVLMLLLAVVAVLGRRRTATAHVLACASVIVFLVDPLAIMAPGFCFSFGAVVLLLLLGHTYWSRDDWGGRPARALRQLVSMQGSLLLGLMPLSAVIFERLALLAMPANLIAVPAYSLLIVPVVLAALAIMPVAVTASGALFKFAAHGILLVDQVMRAFARLPFADITVHDLSGIAAGAVGLTVLWVLLPRAWPGRGVALIAVAVLIGYRPSQPPPGCFDTQVLDVGQGLAVVIRTHRFTLLYDTGPSYRSGGSAALQTVVPFLRRRGVSRIDLLIVSHGDLDHAGGVADIGKSLDVGRLMTGETLPVDGMEQHNCSAGQRWRADGVGIRVLHPEMDAGYLGNNLSCVIEIATGSRRVLLTGDIEAAAEEWLVADGRLDQIDVVVVPHHGSLTSSSPAFVNALDARVAIVAAGHANRWGLPKARVRSRWEGAGAHFFSTAESGAIHFRRCAWRTVLNAGGERQRRQRAWHSEH